MSKNKVIKDIEDTNMKSNNKKTIKNNDIHKKVKSKKSLINKKSIKIKITLWYTGFILSIVIVFLGLIFYIGSYLVKSSVKNNLKKMVQITFDRIEVVENEINIDSYLDNYANEIFISIYDENENFVYGDAYFDFELDKAFLGDGKVQEINQGNMYSEELITKWYMYEEKQNIEGFGYIWVRGVTPTTRLEQNISILMLISLIIFPLLVIVSILGGYTITKKSFEPILKITDTVEKINVGNDLSQRINIENNEDEISKLANIFDNMFDRLQASFNREAQFTSDASHELRTPIAVINSQAQYGLKYANIDTETKEILENIKDESNKMKKLVSNLLTLARMDKGSQKLNIEDVNISELIEIVIETQKISANEKNINIIFEDSKEIFIEADEEMLQRVFINIISNGITYGKKNGYIKVRFYPKNENIVFEIEDNGIGISSENIDKIWNRFYQVESSRIGDNSGLGLSMVKGIIETHKGTIKVESELNIGTKFIFEIPKKYY